MRKNILLIASVVVAGLIGGAMSNYLFTARTSMAQEQQEVIEKVVVAEQFRLVDKEGDTRVMLLVGSEGNVSLNFYDRNKRNRAALGLSPEGLPVLKLFREGSVELIDSEDRTRAKFVMLPDETPSLRLYDDKNNVRAVLGSINIETSQAARPGSMERRTESSLIMSDRQGKVVWSAP